MTRGTKAKILKTFESQTHRPSPSVLEKESSETFQVLLHLIYYSILTHSLTCGQWCHSAVKDEHHHQLSAFDLKKKKEGFC